ncbi:sensor histidine kinase [Faecalibaculum rodentium]|jgi:two-component system sensor histidine kinase CssS|uniref:histidine kinase n=4 Tax=Faecalibaculum rodentium TaxID=1702221 RepID=A0A1Q9YJK0_9FIRM|nr:sensor histidine kinase [Faecalibaculum rodentium]OLU44657.1 two-component sensor histidine kinase [Faecalibaculum rodentium]
MKGQKGPWFTRMSLTQQVFSMIVIMLIFLSAFFAFFISDSIDRTITDLMYTMMASDQKPIATVLTRDTDTEDREYLSAYLQADETQTSFLVQDGKIIMASRMPEQESGIQEHLLTQADSLFEAVPEEVRSGMYQEDGRTYYYRMEKLPGAAGPMILVTYMNDLYASQFRESLINSTVYVIIIVFFLMLMATLIWVFSIIRPLNQIRSYISQIKQGKDVDLYINRGDEIGDLADELVTMKDELSRQDKAKEEMIHNISHDLKTPIATIKSYSESIKDGIYPYGDLDSSVDVILHNAQRLEEKVHNLLYLNRVEYLVSSDASGVVTNMKDVVEQVVLNSAVIRPEIEIITDVEEVFFDGLIEAWRVSIENIMENAFRYAKTYIKIQVRENDLRISNDGPKMPEDRIDTLFRPYEKGEGGRFGLGLSIVSKVTKANNYLVQGYNLDDGVCFRIYRPVVEEQGKAKRRSQWK